MTTNVSDFALNSGFYTFGSPEYKTFSFDFASQSITDGGSYTSDINTMTYDTSAKMSTIRIQLEGIDDRWRPLVSWAGWIFDANNQLYLPENGVSLTNSTARYVIRIVWYTQGNKTFFVVFMADRNIAGGGVVVPAFTLNWKVYLYTSP